MKVKQRHRAGLWTCVGLALLCSLQVVDAQEKAPGPDAEVTAHMENTSPRRFFDNIFAQTPFTYVLDRSVPEEWLNGSKKLSVDIDQSSLRSSVQLLLSQIKTGLTYRVTGKIFTIYYDPKVAAEKPSRQFRDRQLPPPPVPVAPRITDDHLIYKSVSVNAGTQNLSILLTKFLQDAGADYILNIPDSVSVTLEKPQKNVRFERALQAILASAKKAGIALEYRSQDTILVVAPDPAERLDPETLKPKMSLPLYSWVRVRNVRLSDALLGVSQGVRMSLAVHADARPYTVTATLNHVSPMEALDTLVHNSHVPMAPRFENNTYILRPKPETRPEK